MVPKLSGWTRLLILSGSLNESDHEAAQMSDKLSIPRRSYRRRATALQCCYSCGYVADDLWTRSPCTGQGQPLHVSHLCFCSMGLWGRDAVDPTACIASDAWLRRCCVMDGLSNSVELKPGPVRVLVGLCEAAASIQVIGLHPSR